MKLGTKIAIGAAIGLGLIGGTWLAITLMSKPAITGDPGADYAKNLKAGNDALAKKDYAKAKEYYSMLLLIRPGDKTAMDAIAAVDAAVKGSGGDPNKPTNTTIPSPDYYSGGTTPTPPIVTTTPASALPNDGHNCGRIKTDHDGNYDYVRCAYVWYTRSKENPVTASIKGSIPNWKSLQNNTNATQILNTSYPNG